MLGRKDDEWSSRDIRRIIFVLIGLVAAVILMKISGRDFPVQHQFHFFNFLKFF